MKVHVYMYLSGIKHAHRQARTWQGGLMQPRFAGPWFPVGGPREPWTWHVTRSMSTSGLHSFQAALPVHLPDGRRGGALSRAAVVVDTMLPCPACR